jgi:hypothetical protein
LTLSPASLTFNNQPIGVTSAPQNVTVTNTGTAPLSITGISLSGVSVSKFAQTNNCGPFPRTLAANGGSCTVSVTFTPGGTTLKSAQLNVTVAAPATSQSVPLSGTGI